MISLLQEKLLQERSTASSRYITRWPRVAARLADLFWQLLVTMPVVYLLLVVLEIRPDNSLLFSFFVFIVALPFALILDALVAGILGNTPGKLLVGLRVRTSGGEKLGLGQFIQRNYGVWTQGLFMGFLPFTLFSCLRQFKHITGRRPATYDEMMHYQMFSQPTSGVRATLVTVMVFLAPVMLLLITQLQRPARDELPLTTSMVEPEHSAVQQPRAVVAEAAPDKTRVNDTDVEEIAAEIVVANVAGENNVENSNSEVPSATALSGKESQTLWINPVSGYGTHISRDFSVLTGQATEQLLATFSHRSGNSTVSFEQHSADQTKDEPSLQQFLLSTYDLEIDSGWNSYEFGEQAILEAQGNQPDSGNSVSIQATSTAGKIYVLLIRGNLLESDFARYDQLTAAVWNSI